MHLPGGRQLFVTTGGALWTQQRSSGVCYERRRNKGARIANSAPFQFLQPIFDDIPFWYFVMSIVTARRNKKHIHANEDPFPQCEHTPCSTFYTISVCHIQSICNSQRNLNIAYDCSASSFVCWQDNLTAIQSMHVTMGSHSA